jgi:hypothetical protein
MHFRVRLLAAAGAFGVTCCPAVHQGALACLKIDCTVDTLYFALLCSCWALLCHSTTSGCALLCHSTTFSRVACGATHVLFG